MRRVVDEPLATRSTAAQPHHRSGRAGFVALHFVARTRLRFSDLL
jgi:hypothetical protein